MAGATRVGPEVSAHRGQRAGPPDSSDHTARPRWPKTIKSSSSTLTGPAIGPDAGKPFLEAVRWCCPIMGKVWSGGHRLRRRGTNQSGNVFLLVAKQT